MITGNSAYGRTLVNSEKHRDVSFHQADDCNISSMINSRRFQGLDEIGDNIVEIENSKAKIKLSAPIHLGFMVLEYAKLLLLKFYYDFLVKFLSFDSFALIQCDTDSLYLSLSGNNLYTTVEVEKRKEFVNEYESWMARQYCTKHKKKFFKTVFSEKEWKPKECCKMAAKYYLRQPGLFHLENVSQGVIALCSKCYYCYGDTPKCSAKGVNKTQNKLTEHDYKQVLTHKTISSATNMGMRVRGEKMYTYTQRKKGLNYFYGKRLVQSDHVTTLPTQL